LLVRVGFGAQREGVEAVLEWRLPPSVRERCPICEYAVRVARGEARAPGAREVCEETSDARGMVRGVRSLRVDVAPRLVLPSGSGPVLALRAPARWWPGRWL
jgi:hypothetical protein